MLCVNKGFFSHRLIIN